MTQVEIEPDVGKAAVAGWSVFGTAAFALIVGLIRKTIRGVSDDSVGIKQNSVQKMTLGQLQGEIARLEKLVVRMQKEMVAMKQIVSRSNQALIGAQMILIEVERAMIACDHDCDNNQQVRFKLKEAQDLLAKAGQENAEPIVIEEAV